MGCDETCTDKETLELGFKQQIDQLEKDLKTFQSGAKVPTSGWGL